MDVGVPEHFSAWESSVGHSLGLMHRLESPLRCNLILWTVPAEAGCVRGPSG